MSLPASPPSSSTSLAENPAFLREQVLTCLGNKRALLPFLEQAVNFVKDRLSKTRLSIGDLFSGSGIVSRFFKRDADFLLTNDLEHYSEILNLCYLTNRSALDLSELRLWHERLVSAIAANLSPGLISRLYSPRDDQSIQPGERAFYTRRNAMFLDTARLQIDLLPTQLQPYFLAPLLTEASIRANTSGVFKGFHKNHLGVGQFGGRGRHALTRILGDITLPFPIFSNFDSQVLVTRVDANQLFNQLQIPDLDLCYLDPPYNQHPYGSNYFMLNLLAKYQEPKEYSKVSGIPKNWNRSKYNQKTQAEPTLLKLIEQCPANFVLLSCNSEGYIKPDNMSREMSKMGKITKWETKYNTFKGSRNLKNRDKNVKEYLILLEKQKK